MAAFMTPRAAPNAAINITPLVDVLLVLLVIFMLAVPLRTERLPLINGIGSTELLHIFVSAADAEARAFPERRTAGVDHPRRVEYVADRQVAERAGEPERDEMPLRDAVRDADTDAHGAQAEALRHALLRSRRHRPDKVSRAQPVSVQARLLTVSFRLFEASYAADGSNPQWMPQCSQRGSLPGPYASHSIPSSSASYVGKMPSVSR